jgi:ATP-dependent RNA helicase DHX29
MAKKKKPAGNPARGFATTSIASKPKPEKVAADVAPTPPAPSSPKDGAVEPEAAVQATKPDAPVKEEVEQTPEELEAQLERDELQLLVEKHAAKIRRESRRQVVKFETDRRVLRSQSHFMSVNDWVPNDIMDSIIHLAQTESNDSNRRQGQQQPLLKVLSEEDAISRLWTLDMTLRDLGFTKEQAEPVLQWLCANAAGVDSSANVWGLQEALEWLALDQCEGHSFSYEEMKPKPSAAAAATPDLSRPGESSSSDLDLPTKLFNPSPQSGKSPVKSTDHSLATPQPGTETKNSPGTNGATPRAPKPEVLASAEQENGDLQISDIDSDIELDELVPTYLKVKSKLYEIDPGLVDANPRKSKGSKAKKAAPAKAAHPPSVRKLLSQLQQIESDALFDEQEAEAQWPAMRNEIAQKKAAERQQQPLDDEKRDEPAPIKEKPEVPKKSEDPPEGDDGDEVDLLGDMFSAIPDEPEPTKPATDNTDSGNVTLRDFGKQTGHPPRRVLEEAVRSRDPGARLLYTMISPTTYFCRHALTITWSKDHEIDYDTEIAGVVCSTTRTQARFEATTIATVSVEQSESYISTAALFSISVALPKEEKVYLRLPSNWRDLYRDFLEHRKERIDAEDRESIKYYRKIVQDQVENEESDGVVLTNRFKMRNQAVTSSSASNSGYNTPVPELQSLRDLWARQESTPSYQHMLAGRMNLPVFGFKEVILSTIDKSQVTIICGETGCGKSTQIPAFVLEHELAQGKACKVYCTEPRRISAISLAQRVSEELGEGPKDIGTMRSLVGYAIRLESKTSAQTRLVYATVGVVLRMLESPKGLGEITHLVIDEVHERRYVSR